MDGMRFNYVFHFHGTMAANGQSYFKLPCDASLVHVSWGNDTTSTAGLTLGTSDDPDGIITDGACGASDVPATFEAADFDGALCDQVSPPHFPKDTIIEVLVDYDDTTAAINATLVLTWLEG